MDSYLSLDPYNGWHGIVKPDLEICSIPAQHLTLFSKENVEYLSKKIDHYLSKAELDPLLVKNPENNFDNQLIIAAKNNDLFLGK